MGDVNRALSLCKELGVGCQGLVATGFLSLFSIAITRFPGYLCRKEVSVSPQFSRLHSSKLGGPANRGHMLFDHLWKRWNVDQCAQRRDQEERPCLIEICSHNNESSPRRTSLASTLRKALIVIGT